MTTNKHKHSWTKPAREGRANAAEKSRGRCCRWKRWKTQRWRNNGNGLKLPGETKKHATNTITHESHIFNTWDSFTCKSKRLDSSQELVFSAATALFTSPAATLWFECWPPNLPTNLFKESCKVFVWDQLVLAWELIGTVFLSRLVQIKVEIREGAVKSFTLSCLSSCLYQVPGKQSFKQRMATNIIHLAIWSIRTVFSPS